VASHLAPAAHAKYTKKGDDVNKLTIDMIAALLLTCFDVSVRPSSHNKPRLVEMLKEKIKLAPGVVGTS